MAKDLGLVAPAVPENTDPRQAAAWWAALTPDQQQSLSALHPEEIGRLDGLPSAVRDRANRLLLEQQSDALHVGAPDGAGPTYGEYSRRENALRALKDRLDGADGDPEDRQLYLLALDPRGTVGPWSPPGTRTRRTTPPSWCPAPARRWRACPDRSTVPPRSAPRPPGPRGPAAGSR
ncbi:hypothetical protein GCM10025734_79180 [Kitasatospora paranensis]